MSFSIVEVYRAGIVPVFLSLNSSIKLKKNVFKNRRISVLILGVFMGSFGSLVADEWSPPDDYYDPISFESSESLKTTLHDVIDDQIVQSYDSIKTVVRVLDADPEDESKIILLYSDNSLDPNQFGNGSTQWNREHLWPQSFGADSGPANSDYHHLFPAYASVNSTRSNYTFDDVSSSKRPSLAPDCRYDETQRTFEPSDLDKGRVARALFYMDVRYDGSDSSEDFVLSNRPDQYNNQMAHLDALLRWNRMFPPDTRERRRNHLIYAGAKYGVRTYLQGNRNPFVDYPDLADAVFTADKYLSWSSWRVRYFSLDDLAEPQMSDELADPEGDGMVNLVEMSLALDPLEDDSGQAPYVTRSSSSSYFNFRLVDELVESGITVTVEYSETPFVSDSWNPLEVSERNSQSVDRGEYSVVGVSDAELPEPAHQRAFRLRVHKAWPLNDPTEAVYDPVAAANQNGSIFAYDPESGEWTSSSVGWLVDKSFPWVYHLEHGWVYTFAGSPASIWFYDSAIGFFYTSDAVYPNVFLLNHGWSYFQEGTTKPGRWFYLRAEGKWVLETDL